MCDYSLFEYRNRLAVEGETLITHRFHTGSTGFISPRDLHERHELCAVCIPPGARLRVMPAGPGRDRPYMATFTQIGLDPGTHRDALLFDQDWPCSLRLIRLQNLGMTEVVVVSLTGSLEPVPEVSVSEPQSLPVGV